MSEKKYQRGHAYIEIRNGGLFTRAEFPDKDVPLLEEIRTEALRRIHELWIAERRPVRLPAFDNAKAEGNQE